jgi:putative membrane protein
MSNLVQYLSYLGVAVLLMAVFLSLYMCFTPHREFTLIKSNNVSAAISLSGTLIGFALAVASAGLHSVGIMDMALWSVIGLACQLMVFLIVSRLLPGLVRAIEEDKIAYGIVLAGFSIAMGIVNFGMLSY